jgi:hypothetical protein
MIRGLIGLLLASCVLTGCTCAGGAPTEVVVRVKNSSREPLYVDDTEGQAGLAVMAEVDGEWTALRDSLACECQSCDQVCGGCTSEAGAPAPRVRRIDPGSSAEWIWSGALEVPSTRACTSSFMDPLPCSDEVIPALDQTLRAQLCYSLSAPGVLFPGDGGTTATGSLEAPQCLVREFQPEDGVVELSPERGAGCTQHAQCTLAGSLCFGGGCTTGCPKHDFPELGAAWQLAVQEPDDQGFFGAATGTAARKVYKGSGRISAVLHQNGVTTLRFSRAGAGAEVLTGAVYLTLPSGYGAPLTQGTEVAVTLIDASSTENRGQRALTLHQPDGGLLLAADAAQGARLLTSAETAPFGVASGEAALGCTMDDCGKRLFYATRITPTGKDAVELAPGKAATASVNGVAYQLLAVGNQAWAVSRCSPKSFAPYALYRTGSVP